MVDLFEVSEVEGAFEVKFKHQDTIPIGKEKVIKTIYIAREKLKIAEYDKLQAYILLFFKNTRKEK